MCFVFKSIAYATLFISSTMLPWLSIEACTGIKLTAEDGTFVHGRTLEFGVEIDTSIVFVPRGYSFTGSTTMGPGIGYKTKYAAIGAIAFDRLAIMDGINEAGLAVGSFYFSGFANYAKITAANQSKALSPVEFSNWIITQFANVDEVKQSLTDIYISPTIEKEWGPLPVPLHFIVYDKSGRCIVIEPIDGQLKIHDNPIGVLTNSPNFDWHMTNLRNYINLSPYNVHPLVLDGVTLSPLGQGSGLLGLPGDFTPPSRFVRATIFSTAAIPSATADQAVYQAFHILNQFDIPIGVAREKIDNVVHTDFTMVTCVRDPQALKLYFKTYHDQTIRMVDLKSFDFNSKEIKKASTKGNSKPYENFSSALK
jgi:choloylglycine hydrolase